MKVKREILIALVESIHFTPKHIQFPFKTYPTTIDKLKHICVHLCKKYMQIQGVLKQDAKNNYCIILENINYYPEYNFIDAIVEEKNMKIIRIIKKIMEDFVEGEYEIEGRYENGNMMFFLYQKSVNED